MRLSDFKKYEVIAEHLMLGDKFHTDGSFVYVKVYRDPKTKKAYQVDEKSNEYREADHVLGNYGDWKKLES